MYFKSNFFVNGRSGPGFQFSNEKKVHFGVIRKFTFGHLRYSMVESYCQAHRGWAPVFVGYFEFAGKFRTRFIFIKD
jgi:hypothetical protein